MKLIINFSVCLLFLSFNSFSQDSIRTIKEYTYGKFGNNYYTLNESAKADLVDLKHLIVRLNSYSSMREFDYKKYNIPILEITRDNFVENFYELKIPLDEDPFEIAQLIEATGEFETIFFNVFAELNSIPNDDLFNQQWNLLKVSSNDAWDIVHGKSDIIVGIIDVGADYNHDDLILNRLGENGGKDFIDMDDDPYPYDGARHGTAVAGVISATSNNIIGVSSIGGGWGQNKGLTLMHLRAGIRDFFSREIISFSAAAVRLLSGQQKMVLGLSI